jgi:hypothetical protein
MSEVPLYSSAPVLPVPHTPNAELSTLDLYP